MTCTHQSYASSRTRRSAPRRTSAEGRTTESSDYTTRTSTRRSSAIAIPTKYNNVNMETIAPSLTQLRTSKSDWFIICSLVTKTTIFTYSTSKPSGAPIIMSITKHNVYMHITSKILDANPTCLDTTPNCVKIGNPAHLLHVTRKAANVWKSVLSLTVGRSNSSTP